MVILDRVTQMQKEGKADSEIMTQLQNEGVSPTEIGDAINQAKVKNAISPQEQPETPHQEMQPSMMPPANTATPQQTEPQQSTTPQPQQAPAPQQPPIPQQTEVYPPQQQTQPQEDYYTPQPQAYSEQDQYPQQDSYDTETISEIAEQVATEKLEDYKSKVGDVASFKNQIQNQVNSIDDRLKRIENSIQQLQQAVLGKIGEFGESSAMIHKDLDNLHGTVAKLMNPLIDNVNKMKKTSK